MKHTLFILALITASIQTFAQSPRIKLNQITKDSVTGSVLISSPTDSGMVYSRDLFISYGADTVLILGGDTLAATSSIISSVLSDGVTIIGNGTIGSELTADTSVLATLRALSDSLANYVSTTELSDSTSNIRTDIPLIISDSLLNYVSRTELSDSLALVISSVRADNVTITGDGTVGSPLKVDTTTYIATKQDLDSKQDQLNGTGFVKATGTTISYDNSTYLTSEVDGSVTNEIQDISTTGAAGNISISSGSTLNLNVDDADASATNELQTLSYNSSTNEITLSDGGGTEDLSNLDLVDSTRINATGDTAYYYQNGVLIGTGAIAGGGGTTYNNITETVDTLYVKKYLDVNTSTLYVDAVNNNVGIGTSTPSAKLEVAGDMIVDDSTFVVDAVNNSVGIGTKSPSAKLDITVPYTNPAGTQWLGINQTGGNGYFSVSSASSSAGYFFPRFQIKSDNINENAVQFLGILNENYDALLNDRAAVYTFSAYEENNDLTYGTLETADLFSFTNYTTVVMKIEADGDATLAGSLTQNSDIRLKTNINTIKYGLSDILKLNPVEYKFIDYPKENRLGFIAQEVEPLIPEAVRGIESDETYLSIAYSYFTPILTKAIQEQQTIIESQATEIETLKTLITELLNRLQILENN